MKKRGPYAHRTEHGARLHKMQKKKKKKSNVNNSSLLSRQMSVAKQFEFKVGAGKRWS